MYILVYSPAAAGLAAPPVVGGMPTAAEKTAHLLTLVAGDRDLQRMLWHIGITFKLLPHQPVAVRMVAGVHPAGMSEVCEHLFENMGYGPLRTFFEAEGGQNAFQAYGDAVCAELAKAVPGGAGDGLAVFGHAVFLNAIAYEVACSAGASDDMKRTLLDMDLGETQGIRVALSGEVAKYP